MASCLAFKPASHASAPSPASRSHGQTSVKGTPGHDVSGDLVMRIRFNRATYRAFPTRSACTAAQEAPWQRTVRLQVHHRAIETARQRQATATVKTQYALWTGVESSLSQDSQRFDPRQHQYRGQGDRLMLLCASSQQQLWKSST
jgi:hypothetical protein